MRQGTGNKVKPIESFKDLEIWREGIDLISVVYKLTRAFPKEEVYGLVSQMRRAAAGETSAAIA